LTISYTRPEQVRVFLITAKRSPIRYIMSSFIFFIYLLDQLILLSAFSGTTPQRLNGSPGEDCIFSARVLNRLPREDALHLLDHTLLPIDQYGYRVKASKDAQGFDPLELIVGSDPRLSFSYGEFPIHSTDALIDLALNYIPTFKSRVEMLDLGSGCGRLVCYFALTRGSISQPWSVCGLEISEILSLEAVRAATTGVKTNIFDLNSHKIEGYNNLSLYLGAAEDLKSIISRANIIFSYCSTFQTDRFSLELGAMILDRQWSEMLSKVCRNGCIVITTDRALDPTYGWELVDRLEVDNREVMGSTGYIQILRY
jgi:hypothetical protein